MFSRVVCNVETSVVTCDVVVDMKTDSDGCGLDIFSTLKGAEVRTVHAHLKYNSTQLERSINILSFD